MTNQTALHSMLVTLPRSTHQQLTSPQSKQLNGFKLGPQRLRREVSNRLLDDGVMAGEREVCMIRANYLSLYANYAKKQSALQACLLKKTARQNISSLNGRQQVKVQITLLSKGHVNRLSITIRTLLQRKVSSTKHILKGKNEDRCEKRVSSDKFDLSAAIKLSPMKKIGNWIKGKLMSEQQRCD